VTDLAFTRYTRDDLDRIRTTLVEVYAQVHADHLDEPFHSVPRFTERLNGHSAAPGWETVVGYDSGEPVGYAYATPLGPNTRWWAHMLTPLPDGYATETGTRTLALNEIMVRKAWRGQGVARRIHEELLAGRSEERVTLLVDPANQDGRVKALYEAWGYEQIGTQQPFPDSPVFASMTRTLHTG